MEMRFTVNAFTKEARLEYSSLDPLNHAGGNRVGIKLKQPRSCVKVLRYLEAVELIRAVLTGYIARRINLQYSVLPYCQPKRGRILKHLIPQPADKANDHRAIRVRIIVSVCYFVLLSLQARKKFISIYKIQAGLFLP